MKKATDYIGVHEELVSLNPVDEADLLDVIPEPGYDSLPALVMLEEQETAVGAFTLRHKRRSAVTSSFSPLWARTAFVGAVGAICGIVLAGNIILADPVGEPDQAAAGTADLSAPAVGQENSGNDGAVPAPPEASDSLVPDEAAAESSSTETTAQGASSEEIEAPIEEAEVVDDTSTSTTVEEPELAPAEPCTAEGDTRTLAAVAYTESCTEDLVDCDPVDEIWVCSSEVIGLNAPAEPLVPAVPG